MRRLDMTVVNSGSTPGEYSLRRDRKSVQDYLRSTGFYPGEEVVLVSKAELEVLIRSDAARRSGGRSDAWKSDDSPIDMEEANRRNLER